MGSNIEIRNTNFSSLPPVKWCGNNKNSVPCTASYKTLSCSALIDGRKALNNCPVEYDEEGLVHSRDCIGQWIVNPRVLKCNKKAVDNEIFNPLETEYHKIKPSERTKEMLDEIKSCCTAREKNPRCGNLYDGTKNNERTCQIFKKDFCLNNLNNLSTHECTEWCAENRDVCDTPTISSFCEKVSLTDINSKKYDKVCGCYYKDEFYDDLQKQIADKFKIPEEFLSGGRSCYFSGCNGSPLNPYPDEVKDSCKSINLSQCFQKVSLTSGGDIVLGTDAVTQSAACTNQITEIKNAYSRSCKDTLDCPPGLECINNKCAGNPQSTPCTSNSECSEGLTCVGGKCINNNLPPPVEPEVSKKDVGDICKINSDCKDTLVCDTYTYKCATKPDEPKSNLPLIIGLSVGGLFLLLIIFGVWFKMKSSPVV